MLDVVGRFRRLIEGWRNRMRLEFAARQSHVGGLK